MWPDRRTDIHDEANSRFFSVLLRHLKKKAWSHTSTRTPVFTLKCSNIHLHLDYTEGVHYAAVSLSYSIRSILR